MKHLKAKTLTLLSGICLVGACTLPSSHSDDPMIAHVFAKEGLGSALCIYVHAGAHSDWIIPLEADESSVAQLTIASFESDEVKALGPQFSTGQYVVAPLDIEGIEVQSDPNGDWCGASISPPIIVGDVAIVRFSSPGGALGAYVFKKGVFGWRSIERVQRGFW